MSERADILRPDDTEMTDRARGYILDAPADSLLDSFDILDTEFHRLLDGLSEDQAKRAYAVDKWSVKSVVQHLVDCERVLAARALWVAREPGIEIPGFDEGRFAKHADADHRDFKDILAERQVVRQSTRLLVDAIPSKHLDNIARVDGRSSTARVLLWMIAGHEHHHLEVLRDRYGLGGN